MRRLLARSMWLALLAAVIGCAGVQAQTGVRFSVRSPGNAIGMSYFYGSLSPYGAWIDEPRYGRCWTPYDMSAEWRPYSDGRWEYTDYGWSWVSNESWGWATYHYGRWYFDDTYGWVWVPGTEWAPAWVAWRYDADYVGWAPLPPAAAWNVSVGLSFGGASRIPSHEWCFVPRRHMLDSNVRYQVTSVARNPTMIARSRDMTRFEVRHGRPANVGLDVAQAGRFVGHSVPVVRIVDVDRPQRAGTPAGGGFYRPVVRPMPAGPVPAPVARRDPFPPRNPQPQQAAQQRRLESDLAAEHARLARDQQNEMRARASRPVIEDMRRRHAAEQQAFQAHAQQQRQVLGQRMQRQIVRPAVPGNNRPTPPGGAAKAHGAGKDNAHGKGGK